MPDNQKIDYSLLTSETSLAFIPSGKFSLDSWQLSDIFMSYAADVLAVTIANLIKNGYILIVGEAVNTNKIFGITLSTKIRYAVKPGIRPSREFIVGWLEEKLLAHLKYSDINNMDALIYATLEDIFKNNHNLVNPGKTLIFEIVKNQQLDLYAFQHKKNWLVNRVILMHNKHRANQLKPMLFTIDGFSADNTNVQAIKKTASTQLGKFRDVS